MKPMKSPKGRTFPPLKSTRPIMQSKAEVRTTTKPEGKLHARKRIPPSSRF